MENIKIGVIGLGFMGDLHANCYSTLPNVDLVGIADKDPQKKELADVLGDAADTYSNLDTLKKDIGDCNIGVII